MEKEITHEVNIENTNIIPIPEESRKLLNKKLIIEDPLKPYKKKHGTKIFLILLLMITVIIITIVIYKAVLIK